MSDGHAPAATLRLLSEVHSDVGPLLELQAIAFAHYHYHRLADAPVGSIGVFEVFSSDFWRKRSEVSEEPEVATRGGEILSRRMPTLH